MQLRFPYRVGLAPIVITALVLGGFARPAHAADDSAVRISLSLRQAALIETITAATCFAMGGIDAQRQKSVALEGLERYGTVLTAFREGHKYLYLSPLPKTADASTLVWAEDTWQAYAPSLQQIIAGDLHTIVMRHVLTDREETVLTAIAVSSDVMKDHGNNVLASGALPALRLVGHLQLLTQRAVRQSCYVHFGLGGADLPQTLRATLNEITTIFARLSSEGDVGATLPNARIARNIKTAGMLWGRVAPAIALILDDPAIDHTAIAKMLKMNGSVLKQINQGIDGFTQ